LCQKRQGGRDIPINLVSDFFIQVGVSQKHLQKENKVSIKKEKEIKKQKIEKSKKIGPKR
jgi:hypothetical protein